MKLIVGLGNPGSEYMSSRHNIGFVVIDKMLEMSNQKLKTLKHKGAYTNIKIKEESVILLKPLTYMNLSGESIRAVMDYYKISIDDILIIYDDMDTEPGFIRLRLEGSSGGHNGIKSIINHLGSEKFKRLRVGIGKNSLFDTVNYVLGKPSKEEKEKIDLAIVKAVEAAFAFPYVDFEKLMSKYNGK